MGPTQQTLTRESKFGETLCTLQLCLISSTKLGKYSLLSVGAMASYCFSVERTALPEMLLYQKYFCKTSARNTSFSPSIASASGNVKLSLLHNRNSVHLSVSEARAAVSM